MYAAGAGRPARLEIRTSTRESDIGRAAVSSCFARESSAGRHHADLRFETQQRATMDRRDFITSAASGLAGLSLLNARAFAAEPGARKVALIGPGWYGKVDLFRLIQVEPVEVVALADPDSVMLEDAAERTASRQVNGKKPKTYKNYKDLLANEELDLCLIDTPDHWHALPMIDAVNRGLDVWVQKPISVDVAEGAAMLKAARENKAVVQVGMQRRSTPHLIDAKEKVIDMGLLGDVAHAQVYCYYHMRNRKQAQASQPPATLDWDLWSGPAQQAPYYDFVHPRAWRAFMRYGNGILGDMCVHMLDACRWMLGLGWPNKISSTGGILVDPDATSDITDTQSAEFSFPGDDGSGHFRGPKMNIVWNHRSWGDPVDKEFPWGATIYGTKGTLQFDVHKYRFTPRGGGQKLEGSALYEYDKYPEDKTEERLERHVASAVRGHMVDWLKAVDDRTRPVADIEEGHISAASCILANNALSLGRSVVWDPAKGQCVGDDDANDLLLRPYRAPYIHPGLG